VKRILSFLVFCLLAAPVLASPVKEFEGGRFFRSGKIDILVLEGSYREMGRQYGGLVKDRLSEFYKVAIEERFIPLK
jgi:hypothetical protein